YVAVAPVELGAGSRLWYSYEELLDRYHLGRAQPQRRGPPPVLATLAYLRVSQSEPLGRTHPDGPAVVSRRPQPGWSPGDTPRRRCPQSACGTGRVAAACQRLARPSVCSSCQQVARARIAACRMSKG